MGKTGVCENIILYNNFIFFYYPLLALQIALRQWYKYLMRGSPSSEYRIGRISMSVTFNHTLSSLTPFTLFGKMRNVDKCMKGRRPHNWVIAARCWQIPSSPDKYRNTSSLLCQTSYRRVVRCQHVDIGWFEIAVGLFFLERIKKQTLCPILSRNLFKSIVINFFLSVN